MKKRARGGSIPCDAGTVPTGPSRGKDEGRLISGARPGKGEFTGRGVDNKFSLRVYAFIVEKSVGQKHGPTLKKMRNKFLIDAFLNEALKKLTDLDLIRRRCLKEIVDGSYVVYEPNFEKTALIKKY